MTRRSYSQLSTYRQCPRLYHHQYVVRAPEEPAVWTVGGTAFHQLAEWHLGETWPTVLAGHLPVDLAWAEAWLAALDAERERNPLAEERPITKWRAAARGAENAAWWQTEGPAMFHRFKEWWRTSQLTVLDHDGPMLERRIHLRLGDVEVIAFPDAVVVDEHGQVDILDYKTGKPPKDSLQLGVYAAMLREAYGLHATFGLYYMARDARALPIDLSKWPHTKIVDLFAEFDERETAGDYDPTPGEHCRFCPIRRDCPAFTKETA